MLYVSLINSLLETSFIFGQTLWCITYRLINILLTLGPEGTQHFLLLLWLIMRHTAADVVTAIAEAMWFVVNATQNNVIRVMNKGLEASQGLKLDDFALYVNTTRRLLQTGKDDGKPNVKSVGRTTGSLFSRGASYLFIFISAATSWPSTTKASRGLHNKNARDEEK